MGKNKKGGAARKNAAKCCHHLLRPGEKNTPFLTFIKSLGDDIMSINPPPGQLQPLANPPARFIPRAQQGLSRVTDMVIAVTESGSCFEILDEQMITFTDYFEMPKLVMNNLKDRSVEKTKSNLTDLAEMLRRVVSQASPMFMSNAKVNPEFVHLMELLKGYQDGDSFFLMRYHVCYLPLANRCFLYLVMYDYIMDILRKTDPEAYQFIIRGLSYPMDWHIQIQQNTFLAFYYSRGEYDPEAKLNPKTTNSRLVPLRFHRNGPSHPLEDSADPAASHGMRLTRSDLGLVLYFHFQHLILSMQTSLHFLGALSHLEIQDLFPFLVRKG